jgi:hypothetical protein
VFHIAVGAPVLGIDRTAATSPLRTVRDVSKIDELGASPRAMRYLSSEPGGIRSSNSQEKRAA